MSIDMEQFHEVFFEESREGLARMESTLLSIKPDDMDDEQINEIFRAAHSIKGGAGTFGFKKIAEFTHLLETLLDEVRSGDRVLQASHVELLLQALDVISAMISALQSKQADDDQTEQNYQQLKTAFSRILTGEDAAALTSESRESSLSDLPNETTTECSGQPNIVWKIHFKPERDIFRTGNDPLRIFRELETLGTLVVHSDACSLPDFESFDPLECHLSWDLELDASVDKEEIQEVFNWVIDGAELDIQRGPQNAAIEGGDTPATPQHLSGPKSGIDEDTVEHAATTVETESKPEPVEAETPPVPAHEIQNEAIVRQKPVGSTPSVNTQPKNRDVEPPLRKVEVSSIRVDIDKIDQLINMVGELIITQSMLGELGDNFSENQVPRLIQGLEQLSQNARMLQECAMQIRMLPISFAFSRFPRLVHDLGLTLGKKVRLAILGEQTELDKTVMEKINDPLVHLVRNALDHGLEKPEDRLAAGKNEVGTITLSAFHQDGSIIIQIIDDGKGLDRDRIFQKGLKNGLVKENEVLSDDQVYDLVFKPGFSTAVEVTDISGRGVGMDVVRRNIQELSGSVDVKSRPNQGCTFTIRLPLTLAILDGQLVRVAQHTYILPLISIIESITSQPGMVNQVAGGLNLLRLRDEYVPIILLTEVLGIENDKVDLNDCLMVVVEADGMKVALVVRELLAHRQVVIKSLEENYQRVDGVAGATILGDGTVALILDIPGLIRLAGVRREEIPLIKQSDERAA